MFTSNPSTWTAPNCSTPEERGTARRCMTKAQPSLRLLSILDVPPPLSMNGSLAKTKQCDDYKVKEWKGKAAEDEKQQVGAPYQQHQSIAKVCQLLDRSYDTVRRWLKQAGVDTSGKTQAGQ